MDVDVSMRVEQLKTFDAFIKVSYAQIDEILDPIGWTREYLVKEDTKMVLCPINSEHRVPQENLDKHLRSCSWNRDGYSAFDIPLPDNPVENPRDVKTSITIDAPLQAAILKEAKELNLSLVTGDLETDERPVPQTSNRYFADFTPDERRILYNYTVNKTNPPEGIKVEELHMFDDKKDDKPRPKSKLELLIEERDAKRRRISYRKKVHTSRKTPTEILREVIQNQMELLEQIIKGDENGDKDYNSPELSKNGEEISDDSSARSHHNQGKRGELDRMDERYERQYNRPSHKKSELLNRSDEYGSKRRYMEHSRTRNESNEAKEGHSKRSYGASYEYKYSEERFSDSRRNLERDGDSYYKPKNHDDYCEYKRKHQSRSSYRSSEYYPDEGSYSEYRKESHATEFYQKHKYHSSGHSATSTSNDYCSSLPAKSRKRYEHSNHSDENRSDKEECHSSKKHKMKKKKEHHKSKKHKKHKSSGSSSEGGT